MARLHSVGRTLMEVFRPKSSDKSSVIPAMKYKNSKWFKKKKKQNMYRCPEAIQNQTWSRL